MGPAQSTIAAEDLLKRGTAPADSVLEMPRAMVVVAHADDEMIALGARITRFHQAHFIHVTDGAPRNEMDSRAHGFQTLEDYRKARARELAAMFAEAGLQRANQVCFGVADQEASLDLAKITRQLVLEIANYGPEIVFTHPYEGGHPDHDACAFAVHHAVELNRARGGGRPLIVEAPFYHAGSGGFQVASFLRQDSHMPEISYDLTEAERVQKRKLIACFVTQRETLKGFNDATEKFRISPVYDFTRPPHGGKLLYEHYPWGMDSVRFCELAEEAESELHKEAVRPM